MLTKDLAMQAIAAVERKASELGVTVSVAVVDEYGVLVAFSRMDGAIKISPRFAQEKAYTSGTLGMKTEDMAPYAVEGKPYYGMTSMLGGQLTTMAGGTPIIKDGKLLGGIGVGGSTDTSQDAVCAAAGLEVFSGN
jgi:uncharacterized protein GlcG (DUF336 family)